VRVNPASYHIALMLHPIYIHMNHVSSSLAYVHATAMLPSWPLGMYHSSSSNKCCCCALSKEMLAACTTQRGQKFRDWFLNWNPGCVAGDLAHY
jgi:hypothetical protein